MVAQQRHGLETELLRRKLLRREVALSLSSLAPFMVKKVASVMGSSMLCD